MGKRVVSVLLIEDEPAYAGLLTNMLKDSDASFKLTHVPRLEEALNLLDNISFDIVLLDLGLPDSCGLAGLKKIKSHGIGIPLVILTGTDDDNLSLQAVQNGAADYILKTQITPYTLVRSLLYAIERTRSQHEREITIEFLRILNECAGMQELLKAVTTFFQKYSGCQAVAVRLRKGDDYPYAEAIGFPGDFVNKENSLCALDTAGEKARDNNGNPILECMCGNVIRGHFDPAMPFFTARGSFCTNSTTKLMASEMRKRECGTGSAGLGAWNAEKGTGINQQEVKNVIPNSSSLPHSPNFPSSASPVPPSASVPTLLACMRNRCNSEGYESMVLIPLNTGKERFGLLQLNDRRKCVFTPELIGLLERLADQLSLGLAKFLADDALKTACDETLNEKKHLSATMEALRENEERYRNLILMSPDAIFINDENVITYANHAALSLFGASTAEEFLGKSPFSLYHPDYHPMLRKRIRMLMEGNSVPLIETKALRLDGTAMNVEVVASPFFEKGVRFIQVIVRNISERRKVEKELKSQEKNLRLFVKHSPAAGAMFDRNMRYLVHSDRWLTDYGLPQENLTGRSHYEVFPEIDERWKAVHQRCLNGVAEKNDDDHFIRKDGQTEWVRWETLPWRSVDGQVGGIILFSEVITERKKMHEIVERYHLISRYARDSILLFEFDGKIVEGNEAAVALYGYSREELLDLNILQLHRQEERETARRLMAQAKVGDLLFEAVLLRKDGTDIPVEINSRIILNEGRAMILSVARDITERKKRDMELQVLNRTLKAQSQSNQAMIRANNESDYMNDVCGIILKTCGHFMVWIGFAENDADKSVRPVAADGFNDGYIETLKVTWADTERGHGPVGTAIRTGKPKVCRNTLTDPCFEPWREQAIKRGYSSVVAFPLIADGKPFGAITIYSKGHDLFTDDEVQLLSELADDLSYGITAIRLRAELHKSDQRANAILNASTESICLLDSQGRILAANSIAAERMGRKIAEIAGENYFDILPPHIAEARRAQAENVFKSGKPFRFEDEPTGTFLAHNFYPVRDEKKNITGLAIFSSDITARKWAEATLAHQKALLEAVIESSDGPIIAVDRDHGYTIYNLKFKETMKALFGADIKTGDCMLDYYTDPADIERAKKNIALALKGEHVYAEVYSGENAQGRRFFGISYNPIREPDGLISGVAIFARDLTERKCSEDALRQSEERYRTLFNGMTEGFALNEIICDDKGIPCDFRFIDINPAFEHLTGLKRENVLYKTHNEVLPDDDPSWVETYGKVALTGVPVYLENYSSALKRYYQVFAYRPAPLQFAVTFMDITERKLTETALRKSETQLRGTLESTGDGILAVDNAGKVLQANRRFTELWRIPKHLMERGSDGALLDFVTDQLIAPNAFLKKVKGLYGSDTVNMDILAFKDGRTFERYSSAMLMDGARIGRVWAFRDITNRRKAEEILKRDRKTLLKLVKERSAELIKIQTELERAKRLSDIGTLAATVAHELRNPLAGINLAIAVIKRKNTDNMIEQQLERIDKMTAESNQIIDNLLYYSRIRSPQLKSLSLYQIIEECIETTLDTNKKKDILISKNMEALKALPISADPVQIREVFINVLNNAADAAPDSCGKIVVEARVFRELIKIHITDNGHGIESEDLKKVFDPFFTSKSKGTGLGLTICKQIVKMHHGSIAIKSIKGKGTSIIIALPKEAPCAN